ncbi:MAG: hypothetical protein OHK0039_38930 [Bacteroidia bacterium]
MRKTGWLICVWLLVSLRTLADDDRVYFAGLAFWQVETAVYVPTPFTPQVALEVPYAQAALSNPEAWLQVASTHTAYEIDLVFTKYPRDIRQWRTDYHTLLNDRLQALFALDSSLYSPRIRWNLVLQTQCETEEEAKGMFHGFVIKYRPRRVPVLEDVRDASQLRALIAGKATVRDSTVMQVLDRHGEWDRMLVVMDWTGSMYKHGAQLVLWHKYKQLLEPERVRHFVFFNDGNTKKTWQKKPGRTGGVYRARSSEIDELVSTMEYVMRKGDGGDAPENDLEALLTGLQYLEDFETVILIADNKSEVRDIELLARIDRPVRIILCDVQDEIHPHYLQIARETGGSIHTLKRDLDFARQAVESP